jgi:hypothetical protein
LFEFEFDLKSIDKIKRKAIRNSEKMEKRISANLAQLSLARPRARPRRLTGGSHLSAMARVRALFPSLCPVGPVCRCRFPSPTRPSTLSVPWARPVSAVSRSLRALAPSSCVVGPLLDLPSMQTPWTSTHARREPRPRHLPTCPTSLLSIAHTCSLSPTSFRTSSPSLTLCPRYSRSSENRARGASR